MNKLEWNAQDSIQYISKHALSKSSGNCARYVRTALEAGGIDTSQRPGSAYLYKHYLPKIGFDFVCKIHGRQNQLLWTNQNAKPGDIAVMDHGKHGHICMWNGKNWISDFIQNNMWVYKGDGTCYIFRFNGKINNVVVPFDSTIDSSTHNNEIEFNSDSIAQTNRYSSSDNKYLENISLLKKHLVALMLEGEGVVCTDSDTFSDCYLFEDSFEKRFDNKGLDNIRINGKFNFYNCDIKGKLKYKHGLTISETAAAATLKLNNLLDDNIKVIATKIDTVNTHKINTPTNIDGVINPTVFGSKTNEWISEFKKLGLTDNQAFALVACMMYECSLNHTKLNKLEFNGRGVKGTEGWNCGEGTVGFTFWNNKLKIIKRFNSDPRHKTTLPTDWYQYQYGPHIVDLSREDAALFTTIFYKNLINKTKTADLDTCVAEFYLEKAGRGGSAINGKTPYEKAYYRSLDYVKTHTKQGSKAINTFLCTLQSARLLNNA